MNLRISMLSTTRIAFCTVFAMAGLSPAYAQAAPQSAAGAEGGSLMSDEIVVTAQRKEEGVQRAAVSITAFSGTQLRELGIVKPTELAVQTPGLTISSTIGDSNPIFTLRAIGLNDFSANASPSTSVYVDEVSVPYSPMLGFQLFDIARTEVLKGPQGTLYGRNTTGGAINFIATQPTQAFGGFINGDYGNYDSYRIEAAMGGALSDTLAVRASGLLDERNQGYQYNRFNNTHHGKVDRKAGRLLVKWTPASNIGLLVNLHAGRERSDNPYYDFDGFLQNDGTFSNPCAAMAQANPNGCTDFVGFVEPDGNPYTVSANAPSTNSSDTKGISAKLNVDLDRFSIVSVTGYDRFKRTLSEDFDATPFVQFDDLYRVKINSVSQELRLVSNESWPFEWIVGGYFSRDRVNGTTVDLTDDLGYRFITRYDQKTVTKALFAHIVAPLADTLKLRAGIRYTNERKTYTGGSDTIILSGAGAGTYPTFIDPSTGGLLKTNNLSGELGLDWQVKDDALIYLTASRGFKSGGFIGGYSGSNAQLLPVGPEKVNGLELGSKLRFLNGKLRWNSALFYYNWIDFQARANTDTAGVPVTRLINVGDADVVGLESNLSLSPLRGMDINLGGNYYLKAKVTKSTDPTLLGNRLVNAPKLTLNGLFRYEREIEGSGVSPYIQADFNYQGKSYFYITNKPNLTQDEYAIVNGKVGVKFMDKSIDLSGWVKNIFDKHYRTGGFDSGAFTADPIFWSLPRTYGASLKYTF